MRVHDEPAFVLHHYDWSESSLILEVFSRHHGRVALVAKGVKRPTSQFRPVLLPLQPLRLAWGGDAEVRTLKAAHWQGGHVMPSGDALLAGYYLNELMLKLLARDDAHESLFDHYAAAVRALALGLLPQAAVLRAFELLLLRDLGLLPSLDEEGGTLAPLSADARYQLVPESGLHRVPLGEPGGWTGQDWQMLQALLSQHDPFLDLVQACDGADAILRPLLRQLLHYHSGVRVFRTRQLMLDVQRLAPGRV